MANDPVDDIDGLNSAADVSKTETRAELKAVIRVFANADAVRAVDLSGRTRIIVGDNLYKKDTGSTAEDDGLNVIHDDAGNHWFLISALGTGKRKTVRVATTANGTLATAFENGDTVDGVVLATGNLILVKNQTDKSKNGIRVVAASGTPARHADFDTYDEHAGALIAVSEGTANANTVWFCSANVGGTLDTTDIEFTEIRVTSDVPGEQGPPGDTGPTGPIGPTGDGLDYDLGPVADNTARDALVGVTPGQRVSVSDIGDGRSAIYELVSAGPYVWSDPLIITGAGGGTGSGLTKCRTVALVNVAIATALENGDTVNGVVLATGDVVLLTAQTASDENGPYEVPASGAAARAMGFTTFDDVAGSYFAVLEGTLKADTLWRCTSDFGDTIDTDPLVFEDVHGLTDDYGLITGAVSGGEDYGSLT